MVKYGRGGLLVFIEPLSKGPWGLSYIFFITLHPTTFVAVDDPTLLHHRIQVLGGHQEVFDCCTSSKVYLYPIVLASLLDTLTQSPVVRHSYVGFRGVVMLSGSSLVFVFVLVGCAVHFYSHSVECPHVGKYHLPHIWDEVLFNIPELKLK